MTGKRSTEGQLSGVLQDLERGASVAGVCRYYEGSEATIHRWRERYLSMNRER